MKTDCSPIPQGALEQKLYQSLFRLEVRGNHANKRAITFQSRSQLECIRITWRTDLLKQIAGPTPRVFDAVGPRRGTENL